MSFLHFPAILISNVRTIFMLDLQIAPEWRQALTLKKTVKDKIAKGINQNSSLYFCGYIVASNQMDRKHIVLNADGFVGIGITVSAVGLIAAGIVSALVRR